MSRLCDTSRSKAALVETKLYLQVPLSSRFKIVAKLEENGRPARVLDGMVSRQND